jgi:hypothetical protein
MTYASGQQVIQNIGSGKPVPDRPGVFIKPLPNRSENVMGKYVDMGIHNKRKGGRDGCTFTIINAREIRP